MSTAVFGSQTDAAAIRRDFKTPYLPGYSPICVSLSQKSKNREMRTKRTLQK